MSEEDKKRLPVTKRIKENDKYIGYSLNAILIVEMSSGNLSGALEFLEDFTINKEGWTGKEIVKAIEETYDVDYLEDDELEGALQDIVQESFNHLEQSQVEGLQPGMELPVGEDLKKKIKPIQERLLMIRRWKEHYSRLDHLLTNFIMEGVGTKYEKVTDEGYDLELKGDSVIVRENQQQGLEAIQRATQAGKKGYALKRAGG